MREVTERDLRDPQYKNGEPSDYEFRKDGKIVRKDRWEQAVRTIRDIVQDRIRGEFEIDEVVCAVESCVNALSPKPWPELDDEETYCTNCGSKDLACGELYANGREWTCKECGTIIIGERDK